MVSIGGLRKSFGRTQVLQGIDLEVAKGEVVAIIGPSGSGKTTLLRCVNLLERPSGGRLEVDGHVLVEERPDGRVSFASAEELRTTRMSVGMVFQKFNLFPHMTVLENIVEAPRAVRGWPASKCEDQARRLLSQVGLGNKSTRYPAQLSGGEQQRVAIARARR